MTAGSQPLVGIGVSTAETVVAEAIAAEQAGFDFIGSGDHLFFQGPAPSVFVNLAAAAGATTRIGLVSTIALAPLYPPALLAKLALSLDRVSHGRFGLGLGAGGENAGELRAVGVDPAARFRRLEECLDVLRAAFTGGPVEHRGEACEVHGEVFDPGPVRPGGPPIWLGGRKDGAMRRAGRYADVWLPHLIDPAGLRRSTERVREVAAEAGRPPERIIPAAFLWVRADDDGDRARQQGVRHVSATYGLDFSPWADRYLVLGTPDDVAARLQEYVDAGARRLLLQPAAGDADRADILATLRERVLPALRRQWDDGDVVTR